MDKDRTSLSDNENSLFYEFFTGAINDARAILNRPFSNVPDHKSDLEYVISVLDPRAETRPTGLRESKYEDLDVLRLLDGSAAEDDRGRIDLGKRLREHFIESVSFTRAAMTHRDEIRTQALGYLSFN